jgi:hypothetical protein
MGVIGTMAIGLIAGTAAIALLARMKYRKQRRKGLTEYCPYCEYPLDADDEPKTVLPDRETRAHARCHSASQLMN